MRFQCPCFGEHPQVDCPVCFDDKHVQWKDLHLLLASNYPVHKMSLQLTFRFWFIFVGTLSVLSLLYWLFAIVLYGQRKAYVSKYLRCTSAISEYPSHHERELVSGFVGRFVRIATISHNSSSSFQLRSDGVFLLRLIQVVPDSHFLNVILCFRQMVAICWQEKSSTPCLIAIGQRWKVNQEVKHWQTLQTPRSFNSCCGRFLLPVLPAKLNRTFLLLSGPLIITI